MSDTSDLLGLQDEEDTLVATINQQQALMGSHLEHPNPNRILTLHQTALNFTAFSPWSATPTLNPTITAPEGQLLLKKCLFKTLPWMRDMNKPNTSYYYSESMLMDSFLCSAVLTAASTRPEDQSARHIHMLTERTRRRKQNECFRDLRALLPGNPKDKISIIHSTIKLLKELKAYNKDLEKHMEELHRTTSSLRGYLSSDTSIHGCDWITSNCLMANSLHHHFQQHNDNDIHHGSTTASSSSRVDVSISNAMQSNHTISMNIIITTRLTSGSNQLIKVLACLKNFFLQPLFIQSTFEGDIFMAKISVIGDKDSCRCEAQIKDALVNTLLKTHS